MATPRKVSEVVGDIRHVLISPETLVDWEKHRSVLPDHKFDLEVGSNFHSCPSELDLDSGNAAVDTAREGDQGNPTLLKSA